MEPGIKGINKTICSEENCAAAVGSGSLPVFATPSMIALMEKAACESVQPYVGEGNTTVGTLMEVSHLSATPIGCTVTAESTLETVEGRKLCFHVRAYDDAGLIGEGSHERVIVEIARFMRSAEKKRTPSSEI